MNYLKWVQDVKLHLTAKNLRPATEEETDNLVGKAEKATAMIFIRRHIYDALQTKYLAEEDPGALWVALQQYRAQKFTKFSDLISVLLLAEKQNQLLIKNHQAPLTRATAVPEAHYSTNQCPK
ncbi:uncharacterized protein [Pyrus communis]|uniref:uncharacterized protein n=1 Tax=Pyrus communis TaxID=23211 RepID=UPI0035C07B11